MTNKPSPVSRSVAEKLMMLSSLGMIIGATILLIFGLDLLKVFPELSGFIGGIFYFLFCYIHHKYFDQ